MPDTTPSDFHDPFTRDALIHAARSGNMEWIDTITDDLVQQGMCRPRSDASRMSEWIARRPIPVLFELPLTPAAVEATSIGSQIAQQLRGVFAGAQ